MIFLVIPPQIKIRCHRSTDSLRNSMNHAIVRYYNLSPYFFQLQIKKKIFYFFLVYIDFFFSLSFFLIYLNNTSKKKHHFFRPL